MADNAGVNNEWTFMHFVNVQGLDHECLNSVFTALHSSIIPETVISQIYATGIVAVITN